MGELKGYSLQEIMTYVGNSLPPGALLSQAVLSESRETVEVVLDLLAEAGLPLDVCKPDPRSGMTVLHWAALDRSGGILRLLLCMCPEAASGYATLTAGLLNATPQTLFHQRHQVNLRRGTSVASISAFSDAEAKPSIEGNRPGMPGNDCRHTERPWLQRRPWPSLPPFLLLVAGLSLYCAVSSLIARVLCIVLVAAGGIWACKRQHKHSIEDVRSVARSTGIALSWDFRPEDGSMVADFEAFVVSRVVNSAIWFVVTLSMSCLQHLLAYINHGVVDFLAVVTSTAVVSILAVLRMRAIRLPHLASVECINGMGCLTIYVAWIIPSVRAWLAQAPDVTLGSFATMPTLSSLLLAESVLSLVSAYVQAVYHNSSLKSVIWLWGPLFFLLHSMLLGLHIANAETTVDRKALNGSMGCALLSGVLFASVRVCLIIQAQRQHMWAFLCKYLSQKGHAKVD